MRIQWRHVLIVELAILAGCAVAYVAWLVLQRVLHTALVLLLAAALAFALGPLIERVEAQVGRRGLAVAVVYLSLLILLGGGLVLIAQPFISQASALLADLPKYVQQGQSHLPEANQALKQAGLTVTVQDVQSRISSLVLAGGTTVLGGTLAVVAGLTGVVIDLVLIVVMSLYLVLDGPRIRAAWIDLVPPRQRHTVLFVEDTVTRVAGGYLRGQIVMALTIGLLAGIGALIFGLRYPVVVGVFAGLMELIPMFGPMLGAVPALLLALLNPFPTVLWVALYFVAIQQIESNVLGPRITGHAVGLHPLGALLALLAGFEVAGLLGAVFAVPLAGILWVLAADLYQRLRYPDGRPPEARPQRQPSSRPARISSILPSLHDLGIGPPSK